MKACRPPVWLVATVLLAGCSLTKLAYDHLDRLAHHYVSGFVDLTPAQGRDFDSAFAALWRWHRRTQLPAYAAFVRELSLTAGWAQTDAKVAEQAQRVDNFGRVLAQRLLRDAAPRLADLDDAQVAQLLREIDRRIAKSAQRASRLDDDAWRLERIAKARSTLEKYAGALEPAQLERIRKWGDSLERETAKIRDEAQAWRNQFAELLRQRHARDFAGNLQGLLDPQVPVLVAAKQRRDEAEQRYVALLADLSRSCTPKQLQHLHESLAGLATDLDALAAEPDPGLQVIGASQVHP